MHQALIGIEQALRNGVAKADLCAQIAGLARHFNESVAWDDRESAENAAS